MTGTQSNRRGPYAKSAQRRREIVGCAKEVFAEHGYTAASIRRIAERAGLSESGLLHHFDDKLDLLEAVLEERDLEYLEKPTGSGLGIVRENALRAEVVRLFTVLAGEATDPRHPAHDYFVMRYERTRQATEESFTAARAAGSVPADLDPIVAARIALAVMDGLQIQWLLDPSQEMVSAYEYFVERFLEWHDEIA
jgi:AcrR family transcriptional regulator